MTNEDAFGLPITENVGGEDVTFQRLDVDDLLKWANEVKQKRRVDEENRVKADVSLRGNPELQQRLIQDVATREVEFVDLWQRTVTPIGARKVVIDSLRKGGKNDGEAVAVVKRIHWTRLSRLAQAIMSPPNEPQEKPGPLPESDTGGTSPQNEPLSQAGAASPSPDV